MQLLISNALLQAVEQSILMLLLVLGTISAVVFTRRWRAAGRAMQGAARWQGKLEEAFRTEDGVPVAPAAATGDAGAADRLVRTALENSHLCPEALEKLLDTNAIREKQSLERGAQFLGTVGANAPFLGLTGTVLGILAAFRQMADQGGGGPEVMAAIAGALIATAAGLLVAIPAVVLYNLLKARVRHTLNALGELRNLLLARSMQAAAREVF